MINADLTIAVRIAIFLTFVAIMIFGVCHTLWMGIRDHKTHLTMVDIDRRLKALEKGNDTRSNSGNS